MNRDELEKLNKGELVEAYLALQDRLQRPAKTSRTSSKPPSTDRKAKREGSKPGGAKPGHAGQARQLCADPDQMTDHLPDRCGDCGHVFAADAPGSVIGAYDAVDLPAIAPVTERHRRLVCVCSHCGALTLLPDPGPGGKVRTDLEGRG